MTRSATTTDFLGPMSRPPKLQVLWVGPWHLGEFVSLVEEISFADAWPRVVAIDQACDLLRSCERPPELIFLAQPLPDFFSQADIDRLQQLAPLARLVLVAGTWCEGELRTGTPLTGVIRLYWHELLSWWQAALRRRNEGACPSWSQPLDHVQAGRWSAAEYLQPVTAAAVLVHAADYAVYESLSSALSEYELLSTRYQDEQVAVPSVFAGVWDGGQLSETELSHLAHFCQFVTGPVVTLLDFPRPEHADLAQAAGASVVLGKPYVVEELIASITQSTQSTQGNVGRN